MELFIQIKDGQPFEHPILRDNFCQAYPHVDINNLPPEFARFERVLRPSPKTFEVVAESSTYAWVDGVVKDVWAIRSMTAQEELEKRTELTVRITNYLADRKVFAQEQIDLAVTDEAKQTWQGYLTQLNSYVLTEVSEDPNEIGLPPPPRILEDGTVVTTAMSGSTPNVIG